MLCVWPLWRGFIVAWFRSVSCSLPLLLVSALAELLSHLAEHVLQNSGCRGDPRVSAMSVLRMIGKHHVEVLAGFTPKLEQLAGSEDPSVSFISKELLGLINRTQAAPREGAGAEGACNESSSV